MLEEYVDPSTSYSIDIVVKGEAGKRPDLAIEVNGPTHYLEPLSGYEHGEYPKRGGTIAKERHLERAGYLVVGVPWWEWPGPGEQGTAYLESAVVDALGRSAAAAGQHLVA